MPISVISIMLLPPSFVKFIAIQIHVSRESLPSKRPTRSTLRISDNQFNDLLQVKIDSDDSEDLT
eukprot:Awhi_evm1s9962